MHHRALPGDPRVGETAQQHGQRLLDELNGLYPPDPRPWQRPVRETVVPDDEENETDAP